MDVMMHQQFEIQSKSSESESHFSFLVPKNRAILALQAAFLFFFFFLFFILFSSRVDFSVFSTSLFSFNLGRTRMFILCNGIVAILVKGSVLANPHQNAEAEQKEMKIVEVIQKNDDFSAEKSVQTEKLNVGIEEEEEEEEHQEIVKNGCALIAETELIDQQYLAEEESKEEGIREGDGFEELSVEELNKKCEEFIRKMKRAISNGN